MMRISEKTKVDDFLQFYLGGGRVPEVFLKKYSYLKLQCVCVFMCKCLFIKKKKYDNKEG